MKILVVGGAGYVGGAVTDYLQRCEHDFWVYDTLLYEEAYRKKVSFVYGDVRDRELLADKLKGIDAVIWLAALVGDAACAQDPATAIAVNQESVRWLAENYDGRIVFTSTCSVYGAQDRVLDESSATEPLSVYAVTKLAAERYLADKNAIIFRLGTLFGVGDLFSRIRLDLVVNTFTARAYRFNKITVFGGKQWRPLLHVRDAAAAIIHAAETHSTGVFNLVYRNQRIDDLAVEVARHFPDATIESVKREFQDLRNYQVNAGKAMVELDFDPAYNIWFGVSQVKWLLKTRRIKDAGNPRYSNGTFLSQGG
jgi:nucleoside-diphosphate-sugar epimerase